MTAALQAAPRRWIPWGLILATLAVYAQVGGYDFINLDDQFYVTENSHVQRGLSLESVRWAFFTAHASNWHPLTWLSHTLDCQLFGLNPGMHHLVNLTFHLAATLLLHRALLRMTSESWPSAMVAALFALHPLHVESVAWVAERKDVLSGFFWMLTIWAYARYAERPDGRRYPVVLLFFVLGLMAKPMVVTLPFVLLLLDVWPLDRAGLLNPDRKKTSIRRLVAEKLPLLLFSLLASVVTIWAQRSGGAIVPVENFSMPDRAANALVSYVRYIGKLFWPSELAVYYPQAGSWTAPQVGTAGLVLGIASWLVIRVARSRPYFAVGWFWYLGTLVPVIGLVKVGGHSMADRYTYVPLIGLFVMIAWGIRDLAARFRLPNSIVACASAAIIAACMTCSRLQLRHWKDSITLFQHVVRVTTNNSLAHFNLGCAFSAQGNHGKAIAQYLEALRIEPTYAKAQFNLEAELAECEREGRAAGEEGTHESIPSNARRAHAHNQLAIIFAGQGLSEKAIFHFSEAARLDPNNPMAHFNLGLALTSVERDGEAVEQFREALRLEPEFAQARANLEKALRRQQKSSSD